MDSPEPFSLISFEQTFSERVRATNTATVLLFDSQLAHLLAPRALKCAT